MSKLLSQGGFGCVFYPGINCDGSSNNDPAIATKVQKRDFNSENEGISPTLINKGHKIVIDKSWRAYIKKILGLPYHFP